MNKPQVFFTKDISPEGLIKAYQALGITLAGNVAVKLHSGEEGNQNYMRPEFVKPLINYVNGTVVECNTAYPGSRDTTEHHTELLAKHGWSKYFDVDIMDANGDIELNIPNGKVIKKDYVGQNINHYDSMMVLSHFKGHPMGGYGGALKQLAIGCASSKGKRFIHCCGKEDGSYDDMFLVEQSQFLEAMADAASAVVAKFAGRIAYVNVMVNMSVDCDCCAEAEDPCMADVGVLASLDPVAIDQACIDLVYNSNDPGRDHMVERIESQQGIHTIEAAYSLGIGNHEYELISID
ncbi:MAG: DUF362 domain-containing protein [Candidatus Saccharibacteria bacterium]|nr:DUF362 domain-containing protein [Candidatus Saccharibacteria bacterium]